MQRSLPILPNNLPTDGANENQTFLFSQLLGAWSLGTAELGPLQG